jgi:hypothetical protein
MKNTLISFCAVTTLAAFSLPAHAVEICGFPNASHAYLLDIMKGKKLKPAFETKQLLAFSDQPQKATWSFTRVGHPAHPAVICKQQVVNGKAVSNRIDVLCNSNKAACDDMLKEFQALKIQ